MGGEIMLGRECRIALSTGELAVQYWGDEGKPALICLHGWLDNMASFYPLAEILSEHYSIVLVDLPGHGLSDPLADGAHYYIWQNIETLLELINHLNFATVNIVGHSMGGVVASLFAGTFADRVSSLILLDSLGPMTSSAEQTPEQLAKAILDSQKLSSGLRVYPQVQDALSARKKSSPAMSEQALLPIVQRNLVANKDGVSWRTDVRLRQTSKVRLTEEQVLAFLSAISARVLVIIAEQGIVPKFWLQSRLAVVKNYQLVFLPGHHHFHAESDGSADIARVITGFYQEKSKNEAG